MKLLSLDTSTKLLSAAITENGMCIGSYFQNAGRTHSVTALPLIDALLTNTSTRLDELDAFAVTIGPGSFTGLRIGIATVQGLAAAEKKPCYAVSSLESMAQQARGFMGTICCSIDARNGLVYNALFIGKDGHAPLRLTDDRVIALDELKENLKSSKSPICFIGEHPDLWYNEGNRIALPDALTALNAARATEGKDAIAAKELAPLYLQIPQAQREKESAEEKRGNIPCK